MTNKKLNEMILHSAKDNCYPYVSVDTPNGQFRIYCEHEDGYHGVNIVFVRDGQDIEQDICMAEIDPDDKSGILSLSRFGVSLSLKSIRKIFTLVSIVSLVVLIVETGE